MTKVFYQPDPFVNILLFQIVRNNGHHSEAGRKARHPFLIISDVLLGREGGGIAGFLLVLVQLSCHFFKISASLVVLFCFTIQLGI